MPQKILVIGSLNMDMVIEVDTIPQRGETLPGGTPAYIPGGKGANQACAAGKLGGTVTMLGKVGDDAHGRALVDSLRSAGVDVNHIAVAPEEPTGTAIIYVEKSGGNCIVIVAGANGRCDRAFIEENADLIAGHDLIILQMEIPPDAVSRAIELANAHGKTVIFNPAPAPAPGAVPSAVLAGVDYLVPNEPELERLSAMPVVDGESATLAAKKLFSCGVKNLLVTMGSAGALLIDGAESEETLLPTPKVKAVDTTAAGDTFVGAFAVALAEGAKAADAILFANRAASVAVTRKGAQPSMPTRDELR